MKRRNFLGMLGIAPLVAATAKLMPNRFWAGTTIRRAMPLQFDYYGILAPKLIHPFDAYRILIEPGAVERMENCEELGDFKLDGVWYRQCTSVEATPEARALLA